LATISGGVPFGAEAPPALARIVAPADLGEGRHVGSTGERFAELTASAFTLPASMTPMKLPTPKRVTCTSLAASACAAGPPPRYGMATILVPHWLLSHLRNRSG
jgi:hypothetical protein